MCIYRCGVLVGQLPDSGFWERIIFVDIARRYPQHKFALPGEKEIASFFQVLIGNCYNHASFSAVHCWDGDIQGMGQEATAHRLAGLQHSIHVRGVGVSNQYHTLPADVWERCVGGCNCGKGQRCIAGRRGECWLWRIGWR